MKRKHLTPRIHAPRRYPCDLSGVRISAATDAALISECKRRGVSISDLVREVLADALHTRREGDAFAPPATQELASGQERETTGETPETTT
jgi:hypothetical protein